MRNARSAVQIEPRDLIVINFFTIAQILSLLLWAYLLYLANMY